MAGDSYRPGPSSDYYRSGPPGLPPREGDRFSRAAGGSYRPEYNDYYRPNHRDDRPPARNDFDFRPPDNAPRFPSDAQRQSIPQGPAPHRQQNGGGRGRNRYNGRGHKRFGAHNRAILRAQDEGGNEQLLGVTDNSSRFAALEDLSESETDSESNPDLDDRTGLEPRKKTKLLTEKDGDAVPKWSNPDPYTSLPPPDESQTKKKDVVQLIRKAKIEQEKLTDAANPVKDNADFISFNFDDDEESEDDEEDVAEPRRPTAHQPDGAHKETYSGSLNDATSHGAFNRRPESSVIEQRKRALHEAPIQPPNDKKRKLLAGEINGQVLSEWRVRDNALSTPWALEDHSRTKHMGSWLHKEISDFCDYVRPTRYEDDVRSELVQRIERSLRRRHKDASVHAFGSYAASLYLPTADMDLVMLSDGFYRKNAKPVYGTSRNFLYQTLALLQRDNIATDSGEVVWGAKVPIIKFVDRKTDLKVDLSFENMTGIIANDTFQAWKAKYPAMPKLVMLIKQFLHMRGLNEVYLGGIGGFTVTCLATALIASIPAIQSGNMDQEEHLGVLFIEFLDLYGNKFNYNEVLIQMDPPRFEAKGARAPDGKATKPDRLCIIDPNKPTNDISGGSAKVKLVFKCFSSALQKIKDRMAQLDAADMSKRNGSSILGSIYEGDYSSFRWQRDRLQRVYEQSSRAPTERNPSPIPPQPAQFPVPAEPSTSKPPNAAVQYAKAVERDPFAITSEPIHMSYGMTRWTPINVRVDDDDDQHHHPQRRILGAATQSQDTTTARPLATPRQSARIARKRQAAAGSPQEPILLSDT